MEKQAAGHRALRRALQLVNKKYDPGISSALSQAGFARDMMRYADNVNPLKDILSGLYYSRSAKSLRNTMYNKLDLADSLMSDKIFRTNQLKNAIQKQPYVQPLGPKLIRSEPLPGQRAWEINYTEQPMERTREWLNTPKYLRNAYESGHNVVPANPKQFSSIAPGRSILIKRSSHTGTWDKLMDYANKNDVKVVRIPKEYDNAFTISTPEKNYGGVKLHRGDIAYGFDSIRPGALAHELGHAETLRDSSDMYNTITRGSSGASRSDIMKYGIPAAGLLASLATQNPYWLMGASGVSLVSMLPNLVNEYRANRAGEKILESLDGTAQELKDVSSGFNQYLANATVPAAGLIGAMLYKGLSSN